MDPGHIFRLTIEPTPIGTTNCGSGRIDRFPNLFIYECHDIDCELPYTFSYLSFTKYSTLLISDDDFVVVVRPIFILNIKT